MSLTLSSIPGFTELPDSDFNAGATASDTNLKALNAAAKFGVVRNEQFWGFYKNGDNVALPTSPADGYVYARSELLYIVHVYNTGAYAGTLNGTQTPPTSIASTGAGELIQFGCDVDNSTGNVSCFAAYYKTSQTNTNDGVVKVTVLAQRQR